MDIDSKNDGMMRVLSFDVGIKNLPFCYFIKYDDDNDDNDTKRYKCKLIQWDIIKLESDTISECTDEFYTRMMRGELFRFPLSDVDVVVIESQIGTRNPKMLAISAMLHALMRSQVSTNCKIVFENASRKFTRCRNTLYLTLPYDTKLAGTPAKRRMMTKANSIYLTDYILHLNESCEHWDHYACDHTLYTNGNLKIKENLSDAFLTGFGYTLSKYDAPRRR